MEVEEVGAVEVEVEEAEGVEVAVEEVEGVGARRGKGEGHKREFKGGK